MGGTFSYAKSVLDAGARMQRIMQRSQLNCSSSERRCPINVQAGDVIIAGFGKTGTTWLQQIVHQIRTNGDEKFADIYEVVPYVPYYFIDYHTDLNVAQYGEPPRVFKSHEMFEHVPKNHENPTSVKYIVIFRDPLDVHLSLFKFVFRYYGGDADFPAEFLWLVLETEVAKKGGSYWDFLVSWFPKRHDSNVLWLHYEDLKYDLNFCIGKIADFLDISRSEEECSKIGELCSYSYMLEHQDRFRNEIGMKITSKTYNLEEWEVISSMVRRGGGETGQGKTQLSKGVQDSLRKKWESIVTPTLGFRNYQQLYEEMSLLEHRNRKEDE